MMILRALLGLGFTAFCIWLTVRIINRRERWTKWTVVGLTVVFVIYPLSVGPVVWLASRGYIPEWTIETYGRPLGLMIEFAFTAIPERLGAWGYYGIINYIQLWLPEPSIQWPK